MITALANPLRFMAFSRRAAVLVGAVLALFAGVAQAAELKAAPNWTSDQVRAARSLSPEMALSFDVRSTVAVAGRQPKVTDETVTLAPSFTFVVTPGENALYDHDLCRNLSWAARGGPLSSLSCYALPAFRVAELKNRQLQQQVLGGLSAKALPLSVQPYWSEAELGVQLSPADLLARSDAAGVSEYRLANETVVRVAGDLGPLSPDERRRLVRFLALTTQLHPQVRLDLSQREDLPERLEISGLQANEKRLETLVISNVRRASVSYPLPVGLQSDLRQQVTKDKEPRERALQQILLALDGRSDLHKPSGEEITASIGAAVQAGRPMEAAFAFFNLSQQYPQMLTDAQVLNALRPQIRAFVSDAQVARLVAASEMAGDSKAPGDRQDAARFLANVKTDDLPFGTFRYVTFANLIRGSGDTSKWDQAIFQAMPRSLADDYWTHIAAYPWSSFAFKDLGDTYYSDYDPANAWLAYDLGRAIDKGWRSGPMGSLSDYEDRLRTQFPDFF